MKGVAQSKKVHQESLVVAPPPSSPSIESVQKSSKGRARKHYRSRKVRSVTSQAVVVVEEEPIQSKVPVVAILVEEVEVFASTSSSALILPNPSPRLNRPRSSSSPTTLLEVVLAGILIEDRCSPSSSSSSLPVKPTTTLILPIFLDLAASFPSSNTFSPFLDIYESIFSSLSPRRLEVQMTQSSLQFELNEEGKFVRLNVALPWSSGERIDPRIFLKKHGARFSGRRVVLFENGCRLWHWEEIAQIEASGARRKGWKVGGSPLKRSWVGEE